MSASFRVDLAGQSVQFRFQNVSFAGIREIVSADVSQDIAARAAKAQNGADFADVGAVLGNLTVTQTGTGAVARTGAAKLKDVVHVADFGAVGDGTTNDTAAIIAALASLSSGGTLHFANGKTYKFQRGTGSLLSDTIVADNVTIEGNGATIAGLPGDGTTANDRYNQFYCVFQATNRTGIAIRNVRVTGALSPIALYGCSDVSIERVSDDGALAQGLTNPLTITGITQANPGVLTYAGTDPTNGDYYTLTGISGMTELNDRIVRVSSVNASANTFSLQDVDGNALNTSAYTAYTSGGTATLCSNWLRDKSVYLKECENVSVRGCTFKNVQFGVYCIGNQSTTACKQVRVSDSHFEIDAANYTAFFPVAVYFVDIEDGLVTGCTFKNIYASVIDGGTGDGQGYAIYEGDGVSRNVLVTDCAFTFETSGGRGAAGLYLSEAQSAIITNLTFDVQSGANVSSLVRLDAKAHDSRYRVDNIVAEIASAKICYAVWIVGQTANTRAPVVSVSKCTIIGGTHAVRLENMGNGSFSFSDNEFRDQTSTTGAVYIEGTATIPQKNVSMRGDRIVGAQGPAIRFVRTITPVIHDCQFLDGNLSNQAGAAGSAIYMTDNSYGLDLKSNVIGNTTYGGGMFTYGVANANNTTDRIFKDLSADNNFLALTAGTWLRYYTTSPVYGLFDINVGDVIENVEPGPGEAPGWRCWRALRPALTADASSASTTLTIEASFASSFEVGMPVLLTKAANPYDGGYVSEFHFDTVASINAGANQITLTTGIPGGLGTLVAGTAKLIGAGFKALAADAA